MRVIATNGVAVEVEGESELGVALRALGALAPAQTTRNRNGSPPRAAVSDRPMGLLHALSKAGDGLTDGELRRAIRVKSNNALAGLMAALSRQAKAKGLTLAEVVTKEELAPGGPDHYRYRLTDRAQELLKAA